MLTLHARLQRPCRHFSSDADGRGHEELMLEEAPLQSLIAHSQQQGVRTLRQSGYLKVLQGVTSLQEVMAHTA